MALRGNLSILISIHFESSCRLSSVVDAYVGGILSFFMFEDTGRSSSNVTVLFDWESQVGQNFPLGD